MFADALPALLLPLLPLLKKLLNLLLLLLPLLPKPLLLLLLLVLSGLGKRRFMSPLVVHRWSGMPAGYSVISSVQAALNLMPIATSCAPTCMGRRCGGQCGSSADVWPSGQCMQLRIAAPACGHPQWPAVPAQTPNARAGCVHLPSPRACALALMLLSPGRAGTREAAAAGTCSPLGWG